jgi:hypothetical protein
MKTHSSRTYISEQFEDHVRRASRTNQRVDGHVKGASALWDALVGQHGVQQTQAFVRLHSVSVSRAPPLTCFTARLHSAVYHSGDRGTLIRISLM